MKKKILIVNVFLILLLISNLPSSGTNEENVEVVNSEIEEIEPTPTPSIKPDEN